MPSEGSQGDEWGAWAALNVCQDERGITVPVRLAVTECP